MSPAQLAQAQAADWLARQDDPAWRAEDQHGFDQWLAASNGNKAAYWRLKHIWQRAERIKALGSDIPLLQDNSPPPARHWYRHAIAASLTITAIAGGVALWSRPAPPQVQLTRYETSIGARKLVQLSDGSRIELNTTSAMQVALSTSARTVRLDRGEAYFDVAPDKARPFRIFVEDRLVTVLGTKFAVRQSGEVVTVAVLSGRVRVAQAVQGRERALAVLTSGDIATSDRHTISVKTRPVADVANALSWRNGILLFDETPLATAAADFNRYNRQRLVIAQPDIASIRIGGRFSAFRPAAFARLLREAYGVKVEVDQDEIKLSR